ncbi:endonuclease/exonuclease/phosphatase family protein [Novipirellula sp.]|uniref:endonuclease/exonuclease/phosphatase family protein n=1 Tax=Novipirellula sp. TaxID=2795430 RepID=UPI003564A517
MLLLSVCLFQTTWLQGQDSDSPNRLTILSYNIHHGEGTDGQIDLHRLARVIRQTDSDLVAIQEVDRNTQRTGLVDQTETLATQTGLHGRFAKQLDYDGGEYGQAILSKHPLEALSVHWLPGKPDRERRIVGVADIQFREIRLRFATTHLHHARGDIRREQIEELNRLFAQDSLPVILAGDFNATPDSLAIHKLKQKWRIAAFGSLLTFPANSPKRQLDYVAMYPANSWRIVNTEVVDESIASDHRPLLVEIEWASRN